MGFTKKGVMAQSTWREPGHVYGGASARNSVTRFGHLGLKNWLSKSLKQTCAKGKKMAEERTRVQPKIVEQGRGIRHTGLKA